jgi:hypothetical protein
MIEQGYTVRGCQVERFISFGTPEDLAVAEADPANAQAVQRLADRAATKPDDLEAWSNHPNGGTTDREVRTP